MKDRRLTGTTIALIVVAMALGVIIIEAETGTLDFTFQFNDRVWHLGGTR